MVAKFEPEEWARRSSVTKPPRFLLRSLGHGPEDILVVDLQTGEGAVFSPKGLASADLNKHAIWCCPLYQSFLTWVYQQDLSDLDKLPDLVDLEAPFAMSGYRRPGPEVT